MCISVLFIPAGFVEIDVYIVFSLSWKLTLFFFYLRLFFCCFVSSICVCVVEPYAVVLTNSLFLFLLVGLSSFPKHGG